MDLLDVTLGLIDFDCAEDPYNVPPKGTDCAVIARFVFKRIMARISGIEYCVSDHA